MFFFVQAKVQILFILVKPFFYFLYKSKIKT